jgi:GR25 family glycosyltransferase involved in LPS biosynthesis
MSNKDNRIIDNVIDNVYVINMDHSKSRMSNMISQQSKIGMDITRVSAIVAKDLTTEQIKQQTTTFCRYFCTRTMIAIFLSHKASWQKMLDNGDEYAIVMEDDCELDENFGKEVWKTINELAVVDPQWDFLYLGYMGACDPNKDYNIIAKVQKLFTNNIKSNSDKSNNKYSFVPESPFGFHCYAISRKCAQKMIEYMDKASYHVDVAFLNYSKYFSIYANKYPLAYQYSTPENSSQTQNFPIILNRYFNKIRCDKGVSYGYYFSAPVFAIYKYDVNAYLLILLALLLVTPIKYNIIVYGYLILELAIDKQNYEYVVFWSLCVYIITEFKKFIYSKK